MSGPSFSLGLDFGTNTARALIVDGRDGREIATAVAPYPHGDAGIITDPHDPHVARQHPSDYPAALIAAVRRALEEAASTPGFSPDRIIGIGVDATASTPLAVDSECRALAEKEEFAGEPAALAWLWKDHTAHAEAREIEEVMRERLPRHLERCGGSVSSEWFLPKLLACLRTAPSVIESAAAWVELGDWVTALLTGVDSPAAIVRNACAAGHKALFHEELGLPDLDTVARIEPRLASWLQGKQFAEVRPADTRAGGLSDTWAERLGLPSGTPVAVALIDAHAGAVGAGIRPGVLVKILGTSSCDMLVHPVGGSPLATIPGVCGMVRDSIVPGCWGIEAGQSAVGDLFGWFVREFARPAGLGHEDLTELAAGLAPGESGLLALDWNNGNRSLLVDPLLSGLLVGQTLSTRPAEVYRALLESTAFGARLIVDRLVEHGVAVDEIVLSGGIADRNPLLLQIYADILDRPLQISRSEQTCALGAAIFGAVVAGPERGGAPSVEAAQAAMTGRREVEYRPEARHRVTYDRLLGLYRNLHDAFGTSDGAGRLSHVMKELLAIRKAASS